MGWLRRACAWLLLAAALVPGLFGAALAEGTKENASDPATDTMRGTVFRALLAGRLMALNLTADGTMCTFSPASNGLYGIYLFPDSESECIAHVELYENDALLLESDALTPAITARMSVNALYTVRVTGSGRCQLEITREALSRSFSQPMALEPGGDAYMKSIARPGDAHWYSVSGDMPQSYLMTCVPARGDMQLEARLFDVGGHLLAESFPTALGACLIDFTPEPGDTCLLRISDVNNTSGLYGLQLIPAGSGALPDRIMLSQTSLTLAGRESRALTASVLPEGASGALYWESSNPGVAQVDNDGTVRGFSSGMTTITVYGLGGLTAVCEVQVDDVPVESIEWDVDALTLSVGEAVALGWHIEPDNAVDHRVRYRVEDESVAQVEDDLLLAVGEGETQVIVTSRDGQHTASLAVHVSPAKRRYRALLIGEQSYAGTVASDRVGTAISIGNLRGMLNALDYDGDGFTVRTLLDEGHDGVIAGIRDAFFETRDSDFSLVYISCHGYFSCGMTYFQLVDGSLLTAVELDETLRRIPGEMLVLIDCCGSGGVIGAGSSTQDILSGIDAVYSGNACAAPLASTRYRVLASAALEQESYRIGFEQDDGIIEADTVFARALCEAGGWDVDRGAHGPMRADLNYDGRVTMNELYGYLTRRVPWLLQQAGSLGEGGRTPVQTVRLWPEQDARLVFARSGSEEEESAD